jgi:hypothetical protein
MTRKSFDATEHSRVKPIVDDLGPLFAQPAQVEAARAATATGRRKAEAALWARGAVAHQLVTLARHLAQTRGEITVADLRSEAMAEGLLPRESTGRELSWLGAVMPAAGLVNTGRYVRSHIEGAHGNLNAIWQWSQTEAA